MNVTVIPAIGQQPVVMQAGTVVITDKFGNPLAVAIELADRTTEIVRHGDEEFQRVLQSLGINRLVVDDRLICKPPPAGAKLLFDPKKLSRV